MHLATQNTYIRGRHCMKLIFPGTIVSCGTTMLTPSDVAHRLSKCGADCIICTPELAASLDEITKSVPLRIFVSDSQEDIG